MATTKELATDVQLLKRDVDSMTGLMSKLDIAIEKLTGVANSLDRVIAVHDQRLSDHDQVEKELFSLIEMRRKESEEGYKTLHERISKMRDDFDEELRSTMKEMMAEIKDMKEKNEEHHRDVHDRMTRLEYWKWYVIGAASIAGVLISLVAQYMRG
jgi:inorganic triphosphatase YgiF